MSLLFENGIATFPTVTTPARRNRITGRVSAWIEGSELVQAGWSPVLKEYLHCVRFDNQPISNQNRIEFLKSAYRVARPIVGGSIFIALWYLAMQWVVDHVLFHAFVLTWILGALATARLNAYAHDFLESASPVVSTKAKVISFFIWPAVAIRLSFFKP